MRRLEVWGELNLSEFVVDFVDAAQWRAQDTCFSGLLRGSGIEVGGCESAAQPFYKNIVPEKSNLMLTFHEDDENRHRMGIPNIESAFARLCLSAVLDPRVSHGVLADTDPALAMFVWGPRSRYLINMDFVGLPDPEKSYANLRNRRLDEYFKPAMRSEFELAGIEVEAETLGFEWENFQQDVLARD